MLNRYKAFAVRLADILAGHIMLGVDKGFQFAPVYLYLKQGTLAARNTATYLFFWFFAHHFGT